MRCAEYFDGAMPLADKMCVILPFESFVEICKQAVEYYLPLLAVWSCTIFQCVEGGQRFSFLYSSV